jgi:hypothetical protein
MSAGVRRGHREHVGPGQEPRKRRASKPRATDEEWAVIVSAAAREGMAPVAWLMQVGLRTARVEARSLDWKQLEALRAEVQRLVRGLSAVGNNLNQVAARMNSVAEGERSQLATPPPALDAMRAGLVRLLVRTDGLMDQIDSVLS